MTDRMKYEKKTKITQKRSHAVFMIISRHYTAQGTRNSAL